MRRAYGSATTADRICRRQLRLQVANAAIAASTTHPARNSAAAAAVNFKHMDLSSIIGGKPPKKDDEPALEYSAQLTSPLISGAVKLVIGEAGLFITALFDAAELSYADMNALEFADYAVTIRTQDGSFMFSRMGNWSRPFYDALCRKYNKAVRQALFIEGSPIMTAHSEYQCIENSHTIGGAAPTMIYENCICVLPPDTGARRIPLCFLTGMDKGDYELSLKLSDDKYAFHRMGYDTDPFITAVEKQMRALREKTLATVRELDPSLSPAQASAVSKLMPHGAAAAMGRLNAVAPSFVSMLEAKLSGSRAAISYNTFKALCDPARIYVGFKESAPFSSESEGGGLAEALSGLAGVANLFGALAGGGETAVKDPYMLWLIVPSPDGNACAVEFAGDQDDAAATFVYRFDGDFDSFARKLNMALEAISFKREVIQLSDAELMKPKYAHYRMAVQRNVALQLVRAGFVGRVIHSGAWQRKLEELWGAGSAAKTPPEAPSSGRFCTSCGAVIQPDVRFCGQCGARL